MARIWLVRHGEAAGAFGEARDPGLSADGHQQAEALSRRLAPLGPLPICTSPMRRCRETAAPLAARWGTTPVVDDEVGEIIAPVDELEERLAWVNRVLRSRWPELTERDVRWRDDSVARLRSFTSDTVVVSHFVLINAGVGAATGDDRVVCFRAANCSVTVLEVDGGALRLAARGEQMASRVL